MNANTAERAAAEGGAAAEGATTEGGAAIALVAWLRLTTPRLQLLLHED